MTLLWLVAYQHWDEPVASTRQGYRAPERFREGPAPESDPENANSGEQSFVSFTTFGKSDAR